MTTAAERCKLAAMVDESAAAPTSLSRAEVLRASPALFQARMIDRLTRVHPAVPPAIFVPVIAALTVLAFLDMSAGRWSSASSGATPSGL